MDCSRLKSDKGEEEGGNGVRVTTDVAMLQMSLGDEYGEGGIIAATVVTVDPSGLDQMSPADNTDKGVHGGVEGVSIGITDNRVHEGVEVVSMEHSQGIGGDDVVGV